MTMRKKIRIVLFVVCMYLGLWTAGKTVYAAEGNLSVSVSASSVNIGDTVTVTASASGPSGEQAVATMTLSFNSAVLEFQGCSSAVYGGGGSTVTVTGDSFTVTLKAVAAGESGISLSGSDGVIFSTAEELDSMSGAGASVTVNNAATGSENNGDNGNGSDNGSSDGGNDGNNSSTNNGGGDSQNNGNTTAETKSSDNSLKKLTLSSGTLSPAFQYNVVSYTATVPNNVTDIAVSAETSNEGATVESVTGNTGLSVGNNVIQIVVKAENGVTATYKVTVTRQAAGDEQPEEDQEPDSEKEDSETQEEGIVVNNVSYNISGDFAAEAVPYDFSETTVKYHETDYRGLIYDHGTQVLLYLVPENAAEDGNGTGSFFVYDETRDSFYSFICLEGGFGYVIPLLVPVDAQVPDTYVQTNLSIGNETVSAYQISVDGQETGNDFYLFYGINQEGNEGWYQYDSAEGTFQRLNTAWSTAASDVQEDASESGTDERLAYLQKEYNNISETYENEKTFSRNVIAACIFLIVILVFAIINILVHRRRGEDEDGEDDEEMDTEEEDSEPEDSEAEDNEADAGMESEKPQKKKKRARRSIFRGWSDDSLEDEEEDEAEEDKETDTEEKQEIVEKSEKKDSMDVIDFNDL